MNIGIIAIFLVVEETDLQESQVIGQVHQNRVGKAKMRMEDYYELEVGG